MGVGIELRPILIGILVFQASCTVRTRASPSSSGPVDRTRPAREVYRNIQLFTRDDVSAEFLDELMLQISGDLGVSCTYCHEAGALHVDALGPRNLNMLAAILISITALISTN